MKNTVIAAMCLLAWSGADCRTGGAGQKGDRMEPVIIPETTAWSTGDYKVAVSRVTSGAYMDADGRRREGPVASLVVVRKGAPAGESEQRFKVGAGSILELGGSRFKVVEVTGGDEGAVKLQPE